MKQANPQVHYLRMAVETASPARRVVMLHDGAIRFLSQATLAMQEKDYETQTRLIGFAQDIIAYLMSSFDRTVAASLGLAIDAVYAPLFDMLTDANVYDKPARVERVIEILRDMRETWVEVDQQCQADHAARYEARDLVAA